MRRSKVIARVLVACVQSGAGWDGAEGARLDDLAARCDPAELARAACHHGVETFVHDVLAARGTRHQAAVDALSPAALAARMMHARVARDLADLPGVFGPARVPWLIVKGPVLAEVVYRGDSLRSYNDLDVLVPGDRLADALGAVASAGGTVVERNWTRACARMPGEVHAVLPYGTVVDLHWHLVNDSTVRRQLAVDVARLFERSRVVNVGGGPVRTLDAWDTLVHVALHACLSGGDRLVWLKDVEQCVLHDRPPWPDLVARAHAWRAGAAVALVLGRARHSLGLEVPDEVLRALAPTRFRRAMMGVAERRPPVELATGGWSAARVLARSTRPDLRSTLVELARRTAAHWRAGGPLESPPRPHDRDPANPRSPVHPAGGDAARQAFLEAVAAG